MKKSEGRTVKATYLYVVCTLAFLLVLAGAYVFGNAYKASDGSPLEQLRYTLSHILRPAPATTPAQPLLTYVEVKDSCGPQYDGTCVSMRSGPGTNYPVVLKLRTGIILQVESATTTTAGQLWYKVSGGSDIPYPERITSDWYVSASVVEAFKHVGRENISTTTATTTKRIVISLSKQTLSAYDGDTLFMESPVSTGLDATPTPRGTFTIFAKTPSRYMQGPLPGVSDQYYDLPGVPWDMYFTQEGAAIHGAYWHNCFGQQWSHGCVNLPLGSAKELYEWTPLGTKVTVKD